MLTAMARPLAVAAAVFAIAAASAPARADATGEGRELIRSMAENVISVLAKGVPKEQREQRFLAIYRNNFDGPVIAAFVVGPTWKNTAPAQQQEFAAVFETYVSKVYAAQLATYSGEKLEVTRSEPDGNGAAVDSRIVDSKTGRTVEIKWRLRPSGGQMKVRDVLIENISMAQTQRREFGAVMQQRGGVAGLTAAIREKIAELDRKR